MGWLRMTSGDGEYLVEGHLDDVAERLSRDYDPALVKETGWPLN